MKRQILWFIFIYLLVVFQISLFNSFSFVPNIALIAIFSLVVFRTAKDQFLPLLALWGGFLLDVFFYPGFGIGTLSLLIVVKIFQRSRHWIPQNRLGWFVVKLLLFLIVYYSSSKGMSVILDPFLSQNMQISLVAQGCSSYLIMGDLLLGGLIFIGRQQWEKIVR